MAKIRVNQITHNKMASRMSTRSMRKMAVVASSNKMNNSLSSGSLIRAKKGDSRITGLVLKDGSILCLRHNEQTRKGGRDLGGWANLQDLLNGVVGWDITLDGQKNTVIPGDNVTRDLTDAFDEISVEEEEEKPEQNYGMRVRGVYFGNKHDYISGVVLKDGRVKILRYGNKTWTSCKKQWTMESTKEFQKACWPGTVRYY